MSNSQKNIVLKVPTTHVDGYQALKVKVLHIYLDLGQRSILTWHKILHLYRSEIHLSGAHNGSVTKSAEAFHVETKEEAKLTFSTCFLFSG